jgi:hypothetical protein
MRKTNSADVRAERSLRDQTGSVFPFKYLSPSHFYSTPHSSAACFTSLFLFIFYSLPITFLLQEWGTGHAQLAHTETMRSARHGPVFRFYMYKEILYKCRHAHNL